MEREWIGRQGAEVKISSHSDTSSSAVLSAGDLDCQIASNSNTCSPINAPQKPHRP